MFQSKNIVYYIRVGIVLILIFFIAACQKNDTLHVVTEPLNQPIRPAHFPPAQYNFINNPYSKRGFDLGRKLFFDPILSKDNTISCASCHHQKYAFSDAGKKFSTGINGALSERNSPPIFNMAWNTSFMWDGGINHIEIMPFAPIIHPKEMGEDLKSVIQKLRNHPEYPKLFQAVFGSSPLNDQQMFWALAQYMGNLVSANSRYDQYIQGRLTFSTEETAGLNIFRTHCSSCHREPLFTDYSFHNNGLDTQFNDTGRFLITQDENDLGKFKTPTLRNIMLTPPYMHDGRFDNIEDVIEHYTNHIKYSATLSPTLKNNVGGLSISNAEKKALIKFLHTLTDNEFVSNKNLAE